MSQLEPVIFLLALLVGLSAVAPRLKLPYPVLLVAAGGLLALLPLRAVVLSPDVVFLLFLPPLLYEASFNMSWHDFVAYQREISLLAVGLVLVTTTAVAAIAHFFIPGFSWPLGFVLGAIVAPPDAVAATSVTQGLGIPKKITAILAGESLVNDASALIAYRYAVAAVVSGTFAFWDAAGQFFLVAGGGALIGLALGWAVAAVQRRLAQPTLATAVTLLVPYVAYLLAERLGASGVLAVVFMGLVISRRSHEIYDNRARLQNNSFWQVFGFLLNGLVFILIGLQLRTVFTGLGPHAWLPTVGYGLLISVVAVAIRLGWVFPVAFLMAFIHGWRRREATPVPMRALFITSWAGMRGVVSLATALALPLAVAGGQPFPLRNVVLCITFVVILFTLVVQGLTLPWFVRRLHVQDAPGVQTLEQQELRLALIDDSVAYLGTRPAADAAPAAVRDILCGLLDGQADRLR
ncbi:Na+/H+ antiporter, partial [Hymenobacter coccineus]